LLRTRWLRLKDRCLIRVVLRRSKHLRRILGHLGLSLVLLALGVLLFWGADRWINNDRIEIDPTTAIGDVVFVSLLIMPILIYAIISGSLTELKGPGGWAATFNATATAPITDTLVHEPVSIDEDPQIIAKEEPAKLMERTQNLDETHPIIMTMTFGQGKYSVGALQMYVERLSQFRSFELVVFLDNNGCFVAYMPSWAARNILSTPATNKDFVRVINTGDYKLFSYPGVVRKTISTRSTNAQALAEMREQNVDALVVVDRYHRVHGIAERDQVLSQMMLALTK